MKSQLIQNLESASGAIVFEPEYIYLHEVEFEEAPIMAACDTTFNRDSAPLKHTALGQDFHDAKYLYSESARARLVDALTRLAAAPPFADAEEIAVPPSDSSRRDPLPNILAARLAKRTGMRFRADRLQKSRRTGTIKRMTFEDRIRLLRNSIIAAPCRGKRVLLLDDLLQSGATMLVCTRALLNAGAKSVVCMACVKSVSNRDNTLRDE